MLLNAECKYIFTELKVQNIGDMYFFLFQKIRKLMKRKFDDALNFKGNLLAFLQ